MDPKDKATAPTPPYCPDAKKGCLQSDDLPGAGHEPSGYAPRSCLKGSSVDGSRAAFSIEALGLESESDPPDSEDESICRLGGNPSPGPLEESVECCIVANFIEESGIPCQNPDCPRYQPIPPTSSIPDPSRESGPPSGPSPGARPGGVYGSFGGDSFSPNKDIRPPSKETMQVHRDPPISSGPGEMPARTRPTPAEYHLLLQNVIEQALSVKLDTQIQQSQERWRLKFQKIKSLQRLDLYDQWCLQIHHCYCRFHREHPPVPVYHTSQTMELDAVSLEKALEEAFLKVAQEDAKDLPISNTIESWLSEQKNVVRKPESIGSRSEIASHVSFAHHCSRRKEIAVLHSENHAIKINQGKLFSFVSNGKIFRSSPLSLEGSVSRICMFCCQGSD